MVASEVRVTGQAEGAQGGGEYVVKSGSIKAHNSSVNPKQPPALSIRLARGRRRTFFLAGKVFTYLYRASPLHYSDRHLVANLWPILMSKLKPFGQD